MHSGGGVKVVVSAGVSKNGPGAVWVEEETIVRVAVVDRVAMVVCPRIRQFLELWRWRNGREEKETEGGFPIKDGIPATICAAITEPRICVGDLGAAMALMFLVEGCKQQRLTFGLVQGF